MSGEKPIAFLEELAAQHPLHAAEFGQMATLYQRKLWHQLSQQLEKCFLDESFQEGDLLIKLYNNFIEHFALKLNGLKLAQLASIAAKVSPDPSEAIVFLEGVIKKLQNAPKRSYNELSTATEEPVLALQMKIGQFQLQLNRIADCKALIDSAKETLESLSDVDPLVTSNVYYVSSLYYKATKNFVEFYKSSLMYLAYTSSDSLPAAIKLALAVDISLAALLGDNIYNFGELLLHPIINVLDTAGYTWLHELLKCFHDGDMNRYDALCQQYADVLNAQPALVESHVKLREKITLLSLLQLIFSLPADERTIALQDIAARTKLTLDGVEFLLMKAMSLKLVEGVMDQVDGTVQITWVQPQVLTLPQIEALHTRLGTWINKVHTAALTLEQDSVLLGH